jgi:hypothetical protein
MRLLVATRKGLFRLARLERGWRIEGPRFLGIAVTATMRDPRDGSVWAALRHGHFGPKLHVSRDDLASFAEVACPAFPEGAGDSVRAVHALVAGGSGGTYLAGTDPGGLFATGDAGATWTLNEALWRRRREDRWIEGGGGLMLHSIVPGPPDPHRLHIAVSCGGVYESLDGGASFEPRNRGVPASFLPDPCPASGQDTYALRGGGERLWQQNRCGAFRSGDGGRNWTRLAAPFAFSLAVEGETAWTVPIESDERRVAPGGALSVARTDDGGVSWRELRAGLPQVHCYDIVFRHALDALGDAVAFGTTCGRVFASLDRGDRWSLVAPSLPPVLAVHFERG